MNQQVSGFDYNKLLQEVLMRWLRPAEILYILQNHERCPITPEAPQNPPNGSVFLFNKRILRYFRKDGHSWRKKKDGRNVGEAHERLKVDGVDALNCYYAHGDQNPHFQRRIYWMLDPEYEHIVLVHYREVSEGRYLHKSMSTVSAFSGSTFSQNTSVNNVLYQSINSGTGELCDPNGSSCSPGIAEEVSSKFAIESREMDHLQTMDSSGNSNLAPRAEVNKALRKLEEQLSLDDDDNSSYLGEKLRACYSEYQISQDLGILDDSTGESPQESHEIIPNGLKCWEHGQVESEKQDGCSETHLFTSGDNQKQASHSLGLRDSVDRKVSPWNQILELNHSVEWTNIYGRTSNLMASVGVNESSISRTRTRGTHFLARKMIMHDSSLISSERGGNVIPFERYERFTGEQLDHGRFNADNSPVKAAKHRNPECDPSLQLPTARRSLLDYDNPIDSSTSLSQFPDGKVQQISGISTLVVNPNVMKNREENNIEWMEAIDLTAPNNTYFSDFPGMWFDQGHLGIGLEVDSGLTVSAKQRFSIREISPEWAFSSGSTKVFIIGEFFCNPSECSWAIMFGDTEVPAEIVQQGVLRCLTPQHDAGKVTMCITSGNRESCSEVREFAFFAKPTSSDFVGTSSKVNVTKNVEEQLLLARLVHTLLYGSDGLSAVKVSAETESEDRWAQIIKALVVDSVVPSGTLDWIMHELLKDKVNQWLLSKYPRNEGHGCLTSKQEQGIIHMISGLGYEWALNPILDSGVNINFRDANGWTALHWASRFGREEMVAALVASGASAGAVTDSTPQDPVGKTAGAIAAASGHTGLAGYLSEADLTSHLLSLTMEEIDISKGSAEEEAERAVESISVRSGQMHVGGTEDELSLKDSLAAVRNAAQAAARIQAAFRAHSFRKRQEKTAISQCGCLATPEDIHGLPALSKFQRTVHSSRDQKFDKAALSIQRKYRGWKGHKTFLTLRQHVVKIQAHVRGHQQRKKYKEFVWAVNVLEKVILRWRRKGVGLRGYRAEPELIDEEEEEEDIVKVFQKQKVNVAIDQAMARVFSMVESSTARQQYRRMLEKYRIAKAGSGNAEATLRLEDDIEITQSDDFMNSLRY